MNVSRKPLLSVSVRNKLHAQGRVNVPEDGPADAQTIPEIQNAQEL